MVYFLLMFLWSVLWMEGKVQQDSSVLASSLFSWLSLSRSCTHTHTPTLSLSCLGGNGCTMKKEYNSNTTPHSVGELDDVSFTKVKRNALCSVEEWKLRVKNKTITEVCWVWGVSRYIWAWGTWQRAACPLQFAHWVGTNKLLFSVSLRDALLLLHTQPWHPS